MTAPQDPGGYGSYGPPPQSGQYQQPPQPYGPPPGQYQQPPQPYGAPPGYGYPPPPPPMAAAAPRVSVLWAGALMVLGGAALAVGAFLDWAKVTYLGRHVSITGLGSLSGDEEFKRAIDPSKVTDGKVTLTLGILLIIGGIIILARQGRIWVGIVGTVLAAICLIIALADFGQASDVNDKYKVTAPGAHLSTEAGLTITLLGAIVALAFSIVAICVRRPKV